MILHSQLLFSKDSGYKEVTVVAFFLCALGFVLCMGGQFGCASSQGAATPRATRGPLTTELSKGFQPVRVNAVAIYPLYSEDSDKQLPQNVTEMLLAALEQKTSLEILNRSQGARLAQELRRVENKAQALRQTAAEFGKSVGAQGVLYGLVTHYNPSSGSKFGADSLASTGFRLWLIDPMNGRTLWTVTYQNTEQPLSENLFRLGEKMREGVGFRDADELLKSGFLQAAEELEGLRTKK